MPRTHLLGLLALSSVPSAQRLIAVDSGGALFDLDMATGAKTQFGTVSVNAGTCGGLAYDAGTRTVYLSSTTNDSLYRLDLTTGNATLIGPYGDPAIVMHGFEWNPRISPAELAGVSWHNNGLYRINPATGAATLLGTSGLTSFTNLGIGWDGISLPNTTYATNSGTDSLYVMNPSTGAVTLVGPLNGPTNPHGLAFDSDTERMFLIDSNTDGLYTVNLITGAATLVGPMGAGNLLGLVYIPRAFGIESKCLRNVSLQVDRLPPSADWLGRHSASFRSGGVTSSNVLRELLWAYRTDNDRREFLFNSGAGSGLGPILIPDRDTAVLSWTNCDGRGFDAQLVYSVYSTSASTSASSGVLSQRLTITNRTAASIQLSVFAYANIDVIDGGFNYGNFWPGVSLQQRILGPMGPDVAFFLGCRPTAYETSTPFGPSAVIAKLTNTTLDDLNNTGGVVFGPDNWTSAYQWRDVRIAPGGNRTFDVAIGGDFPLPCCIPAAFETFCVGKAGTRGVPVWSPALLRVCGLAELRITNGYPGSAPFVLVGVPPTACVPVPPFGNLAVLPILTSFSMPAFDSGLRESRLCLPVPCNSDLCGLELTMQAWFADPGASGFIVHTGGAKFTVGSI